MAKQLEIKTREGWGARLESARLDANLKQEDVATKLGITQPTVSHHESERRQPGKNHWLAYARTYRVSVLWLQYGMGPRHITDGHTMYIMSTKNHAKGLGCAVDKPSWLHRAISSMPASPPA